MHILYNICIVSQYEQSYIHSAHIPIYIYLACTCIALQWMTTHVYTYIRKTLAAIKHERMSVEWSHTNGWCGNYFYNVLLYNTAHFILRHLSSVSATQMRRCNSSVSGTPAPLWRVGETSCRQPPNPSPSSGTDPTLWWSEWEHVCTILQIWTLKSQNWSSICITGMHS